jgi:hypothetical protein
MPASLYLREIGSCCNRSVARSRGQDLKLREGLSPPISVRLNHVRTCNASPFRVLLRCRRHPCRRHQRSRNLVEQLIDNVRPVL